MITLIYSCGTYYANKDQVRSIDYDRDTKDATITFIDGHENTIYKVSEIRFNLD